MKKNLSFCVALMMAHWTSSVSAIEFQPLGNQAMSMGGAGVAGAKGAMAPYFNPALLAKKGYAVEISLSAGVAMREQHLADNLDTLNSLDLSATLTRIANNAPVSGSNSASDKANIVTMQNVITKMGTEVSGFSGGPMLALGAQMGRFGVGVYGYGEAAARAVVSPNHVNLIVPGTGSFYYSYDPVGDAYTLTTLGAYQSTSLDYAISNQLNYLQLSGITLVEAPLAYAHPFQTRIGSLAVGTAVKFMHGTAITGNYGIDALESNDIMEAFDDNIKESTAVGVDLGVSYVPTGAPSLTIGLVGKNINQPRFKGAGGGSDIEVPALTRAGINLDVTNSLSLAMDVDLSTNDGAIKGLQSQYLGGGMSWHPSSWFSLRAGAMTNLADSNSDEGVVYTFGAGLGAKWIQLDLAGMISSNQGTFDGKKIPRLGRLSLALVSRW